jgi:predicted RNA binding protein YcfA (HicA-like mRNA interferase family)
MSFNIPVTQTSKAIKAFNRLGYSVDRGNGSHIIMTQPNKPNIVIPNGKKDVAVGTLRNILQRANIPIELFLSHLK